MGQCSNRFCLLGLHNPELATPKQHRTARSLRKISLDSQQLECVEAMPRQQHCGCDGSAEVPDHPDASKELFAKASGLQQGTRGGGACLRA